jgi:organic radical activating enzyme
MIPLNNPKLKLLSVEFYITNVCNLACTGCNRFNNFKFTGQQQWDEYKIIYTQWAAELQIGTIGILGGEPLLHPGFMSWFSNIRALWPRSSLSVVTNGYRLTKVAGLYEFLLRHRFNTQIHVGIHNKRFKTQIMENVRSFLKGKISYNFDYSNKYQENMMLTDSNKVILKVEHNWWFHQGTLIQNIEADNFTLYQSDEKKAHDNCSMKLCHTFSDGKLYKCGVIAILPKFAKQHTIQLSPEDSELMHSYVPLSIDDTYEIKKEFLENLNRSIPQCKFCPEVYIGDQIYAEEKKVIAIRNNTTL